MPLATSLLISLNFLIIQQNNLSPLSLVQESGENFSEQIAQNRPLDSLL